MPGGSEFDEFERASWEGRAEAYDRGFAKLTEHMVEPLLSSLRVGPRSRLLDIGCGPGPVTAAALARGAQVMAADADLDMLEVVARRHPHAEVRLATLPDLPFADEEFDAVVGNFVINHTGDPLAAVEELHRVLRPGGRIALTCWKYPEMQANSVFAEAVEAAGAHRPPEVPETAPFSRFANPHAFSALLKEAGFVGAGTDTVNWTHTVDPIEWWNDVLAGTALNPAIINRQPPELIDQIKAAYLKIVSRYTAPSTQTTQAAHAALPACALMAHATR